MLAALSDTPAPHLTHERKDCLVDRLAQHDGSCCGEQRRSSQTQRGPVQPGVHLPQRAVCGWCSLQEKLKWKGGGGRVVVEGCW